MIHFENMAKMAATILISPLVLLVGCSSSPSVEQSSTSSSINVITNNTTPQSNIPSDVFVDINSIDEETSALLEDKAADLLQKWWFLKEETTYTALSQTLLEADFITDELAETISSQGEITVVDLTKDFNILGITALLVEENEAVVQIEYERLDTVTESDSEQSSIQIWQLAFELENDVWRASDVR